MLIMRGLRVELHDDGIHIWDEFPEPAEIEECDFQDLRERRAGEGPMLHIHRNTNRSVSYSDVIEID